MSAVELVEAMARAIATSRRSKIVQHMHRRDATAILPIIERIRTQAVEAERTRVVGVLEKRRQLYLAKVANIDPFADYCLNLHDQRTECALAMECAIADAERGDHLAPNAPLQE